MNSSSITKRHNTTMTTTTWKLKLTIWLAIILTIRHGTKADTKPFEEISVNIAHGSAYRYETISLENDKDLEIKGSYQDQFDIPNDPDYALKATIVYVADKNGYRAKYKLIKDKKVIILYLNPSTLKSLGG